MYTPSALLKFTGRTLVSSAVARKLFLPELNVGFRLRDAKATVMAVPVASMHEDNLSPSSEHEIGFPRKASAMQPVAVAEGVEGTAHGKLRAGVFGLDPGHQVAASGGRKSVHVRLFSHPIRYGTLAR